MKKLHTLLVCTVLTVACWGQQQVRFYATVSHDSIGVNGEFEITFHIEGTDYSEFQLPSLNFFYVVAGPYQSTHFEVIDGRFSRETSYTYRLQPRSSGIFLIEPASIRVNGEILETQPVRIEIFGSTLQQPTDSKPAYPKKKKKKYKGKIYTI